MLELSSEERIIYELAYTPALLTCPEELTFHSTLEKKFRDSINKAMTTKTAGKNFQMYLVYIMRLRQAICHPFLLEGMMRDSFTLADIRELRRSLTDVSGRSPVYREIQHWCERAQGPDNLLTLTPGILNQGQRAYTSSMDSYLQRLNDEMVLELMQCKICGDHSIHPRQTIEVMFLSNLTRLSWLTCRASASTFFVSFALKNTWITRKKREQNSICARAVRTSSLILRLWKYQTPSKTSPKLLKGQVHRGEPTVIVLHRKLPQKAKEAKKPDCSRLARMQMLSRLVEGRSPAFLTLVMKKPVNPL